MTALKVLLDTDIGSDIDDAICLAYLLAQPRCQLLGITTMSGEAEQRATLASALCHAADTAVPIFPGAEAPLSGLQRQPHAPQAAALARWQHETSFPADQAVSFLRRTIHAHPGEVVLLAIGPLTNIAQLFIDDPEIPRLLKSLVLMCGHFTYPLPEASPLEWNAVCDPVAAEIVYRALVPVHRSVGVDVTSQVTMPAQAIRSRFQAPLLQPVCDFAEVWFKERDVITFHDPLAATTLFDDHICTFERGLVEVETNDQASCGRTS